MKEEEEEEGEVSWERVLDVSLSVSAGGGSMPCWPRSEGGREERMGGSGKEGNFTMTRGFGLCLVCV